MAGFAGHTQAYNDQESELHDAPQGAPDADNATLMRQVLEWWHQVREEQAASRTDMALDADFADGDQISDEERQILMARGQPPVTMNLIKPAVEWVVGTEKRTRMDFRAYPRKDDEGANEGAERKTKLLKYVSDASKGAKARSAAFRDAITVGVGWLEDGIRNDETDELAYTRRESWRNIWYDHLSIEEDCEDARFIFRQKFVDLDIAIAMFPHRAAALVSAAQYVARTDSINDEEHELPQAYRRYDAYGYRIGGISRTDSISNRRERVRLVECWFREPRQVTRMRGYDSPLHLQLFDDQDQAHAQAVAEQVVSTYDAVELRTRCVMFCERYLLDVIDSPYRHNRFPFTPIWGYRRDRDNAPYGIVRNMRDAQRDHNTRFSKALFILSSNRVIAERGVVDDEDELERQAAKPNGVIWLAKNSSQKRFELQADNALAEEHLGLMSVDREYMTRSSGVTDENLGQSSNAISGKAILAKQNEGSVVTFTLFDNLRHAIQCQGEKQLSNVEQFYDMPMQIRIVGENAKHEFEAINQPVFDPVSGRFVIKNDITADIADFRIDTADFRQSIRMAQYESLVDMLSKMPQELSIQLLDLVVDMSDVANKDELVRRIRSINGQTDAEEKLSPEEQAARSAQAQEAQQAKQMQIDRVQSEIDERRAKIDKLRAETTGTKVASVQEATEAAATMATMPAVAPVTDALLESAGFDDQRDIGRIDVPAAPAPAIDAQVQAEAAEHKRPAPMLDPNKQYEVDSRERAASAAKPAEPAEPGAPS